MPRKSTRPQKKPHEPDPAQEYVPPDVDPKARRDRLIDLANMDVLLCARTLSRMRVWVPNGPRKYKATLQQAPMDWWEYFSNINVEQWIFMWVLAFSRRIGAEMDQFWIPVYQYHIGEKYVIRDLQLKDGEDLVSGVLKPGKEVSGAFLDFSWVPKDRDSSKPIVVMECDENAHYNAGWDAERYREVFVIRELRKTWKNNQNILIIRLNPHEYINVPKERNQLNVYTTEPKRDDRMASIRELVLWGLGISHQNFNPMKPGITIAFAYYDRWYDDVRGQPNQHIHYHHYATLRNYLNEVNRAAGNFGVPYPRMRRCMRTPFLKMYLTPSNETCTTNPFS